MAWLRLGHQVIGSFSLTTKYSDKGQLQSERVVLTFLSFTGGKMTPKKYYDETIGKAIDTDNYPRSNPYQCWDYFDYFCRLVGFTGSRYCASTRYVGDLWFLRDAEGYHYYTDFRSEEHTSELQSHC